MTCPVDPFMPAVELAAAIRRKEVSPVEVADCYLGRMDELDPRLNAFCYRADDDVRKAASAAADAVVRAGSAEDLPPFHGVPLPIKDVLDVAGWPTTHGSAGASKAPAAASDPVVQRFADAGFVLLGKTTSEFGTVPYTESEALGISRNPWDPGRTPGGSSSGAGAAVAAGMAPIAHAEDGGGSIRIPASCTGLVGLKPTRGRVTNATVGLEGFVTSGVLTRSVADTAAALDVLARHDPAAWWSPPAHRGPFVTAMTVDPPGGLRIGVLAGSPIGGWRWTRRARQRSTPPFRRSSRPATMSSTLPFGCLRPATSSRRSRRSGMSAVPASRSRTPTASSRTTGPCVRRHGQSTRGPTWKA
jgi:amidase